MAVLEQSLERVQSLGLLLRLVFEALDFDASPLHFR